MTSEPGGNTALKGRSGPAHSDNPGGRSAGRGVGAVLRDKLDEPDADGVTPAERIARKLIDLAVGGDVRAIGMIYDRTEGKPGQSIAVKGPEDCWTLGWHRIPEKDPRFSHGDDPHGTALPDADR